MKSYESMWLKSLMMEVCVKIPEYKHIYSIDRFFYLHIEICAFHNALIKI